MMLDVTQGLEHLAKYGIVHKKLLGFICIIFEQIQDIWPTVWNPSNWLLSQTARFYLDLLNFIWTNGQTIARRFAELLATLLPQQVNNA